MGYSVSNNSKGKNFFENYKNRQQSNGSTSFNNDISYIDTSNTDVELITSNNFNNNSTDNLSAKITEQDRQNLEKLKDLMQTGEKSDKEVLDLLLRAIENELSNGNEEARNILKILIKLKQENPDLSYKFTDGSGPYGAGSYAEGSTVYIDKTVLDNDQFSVIFHETGHLLHGLILNGLRYVLEGDNLSVGTDVTNSQKLFENAKAYSEDKIQDLLDFLASWDDQTWNEARQDFYNQYGLEDNDNGRDKMIEMIKEQIEKWQDSDILTGIIKFTSKKDSEGNYDLGSIPSFLLDKMGIDSDVYEKMLNSECTIDELADQIIVDEISKICENKQRDNGYAAVTDIMDSVYDGEFSDNHPIKETGYSMDFYGHGSDYYSDQYKKENELIANFTDLMTSGNEEAIELLRETFGDDLINTAQYMYDAFMALNRS